MGNIIKKVAPGTANVGGFGLMGYGIMGELTTSVAIACGVGGAVILGLGIYGIYHLTMKDGKVFQANIQAQSDNSSQNSFDQSQKTYEKVKVTPIPKWQPSQLNRSQFIALKSIATISDLLKTMEGYTSQNMRIIMRQPCKMKCCKDIRADPYEERFLLQTEVKNNQKCVLCHNQATIEYIQPDLKLQYEIQGFRHYLFRTIKILQYQLKPSSQEFQKWQKAIDSNFGQGYTKEYILDKKVEIEWIQSAIKHDKKRSKR